MPIQTSVITGTVAHKHSATGGSSDGGKLEAGGLGGDTSFDLSQGSIMYSNGTSLEELTKPVTPNNEVLTFATSATSPSWVAGSSALTTLTRQTDSSSTEVSTTSSSFVDIDSSNFSKPLQAGAGMCIVDFNFQFERAGAGFEVTVDFSTDGTQTGYSMAQPNATPLTAHYTAISQTLGSQTAALQFKGGGATAKIMPDSGYTSTAFWLEIG